MARVKIKDHDRRAGLSIAVVAASALVLWYSWVLWSMDRRVHIVQRSLHDLRLTCVCDHGHRFEAAGSEQSLPCGAEGCTQRAWPVWTFQCSKHGAFAAHLRYGLVGGRPRIIKARFPGEQWQDVEAKITCPRCERALEADLSLRRGPLDAVWPQSTVMEAAPSK